MKRWAARGGVGWAGPVCYKNDRGACNTFNPLSPNSDQHQFSPNNIHTRSRDKVMRINEIIT